jgi:hypothetical protein
MTGGIESRNCHQAAQAVVNSDPDADGFVDR